ncbi:hypothetical protein FE394_04760 [Xenorhabdus sp. Reich]|uniref:Uncharacterized protein n=1 Tax=Xenorhabdus littoralis TaxID=2582835 RepID=A0ABU4SIV8_9GAMM|nr:hypothetical protein [Xenorhabdus sp. Reich]
MALMVNEVLMARMLLVVSHPLPVALVAMVNLVRVAWMVNPVLAGGLPCVVPVLTYRVSYALAIMAVMAVMVA